MPLDTQHAISLGAAFVAGIVGSVHCFAMCGGLAGALGMRAHATGHSSARSFAYATLTQLGRIGSYALVGALVGAFGTALAAMMSWVHLAATLRLLAGCVLLAIALRVAFGWNAFAWLERAGMRIWSRRLSKLAPSAARRSGIAQALAMGALWGWLPCGLVYSMLLFAAFAASAPQGALIMLAFGAGTLPSMLASSVLAGQATRAFSAPSVRWVAATLLTAFAIWTIVAALQHRGHH